MPLTFGFRKRTPYKALFFNRVQIYFFLLKAQNVNLLFRVAIELKKLIIPLLYYIYQRFAKRR